MASLLIVNADDFGISEGVNQGILEAHRHGVLTSTTIMANMPAFGHALGLSREHPSLGVGVHLNLSTGRPISPPDRIPNLLDAQLRFGPLTSLLRALTWGRADVAQIEAELAAQIERVMGSALSPTHLDSHHHLHTHPALQPVVIRLALRYGIPAVRCPVEFGIGETLMRAGMLLSGGKGAEIGGNTMRRETARQLYLKTAMLSLLGRVLRARVRRAGLAATDHFRGLLLGMPSSRENLQLLLRNLPEGSTELMCHPGHVDAELRERTSYAEGRQRELEVLVDPECRRILDQAGTILGSYASLNPKL